MIVIILALLKQGFLKQLLAIDAKADADCVGGSNEKESGTEAVARAYKLSIKVIN